MGCCGQNTTGAGTAAVDTGKRVNYTKGMLLGVDDFVQEQAWGIARRHELAREVLGYGTVRGLQVSMVAGEPRVKVTPGMAWMPSGTPVCVPSEQCCNVNDWLKKHWAEPGVGSAVVGQPQPAPLALYVVLAYDTCLTDKVPIPGEPCRSEEDLTADSRVADCFRLELRTAPPDQVEEDAIRDFADWLAHVPVDPTSPPLSDEAFVEQLRTAAHLWLTPGSPHTGDFMFGSPPAGLGSTDELVRAALRLWVTELRPLWRARYGCGPLPATPGGVNDAVLLAELRLNVFENQEAEPDPEVLEDRRPVLLSLRMVQELITQNPAPEPGNSVVPANAFGLPADPGSDTAYSRADHSHGTPALPPLAGDAEGPVTATRVVALRGEAIAAATPAEADVLTYAGGEWTPTPLPELGGDATGPIGENTVVGLQAVPVSEQTPSDGQALIFVDGSGDDGEGTGAWTPTTLELPTAGTDDPSSIVFGAASDAGSSPDEFARADHVHGWASMPEFAGDANGSFDNMAVTALRGRLLVDEVPSDGHSLVFSTAAGGWHPAAATGGPPAATAAPPALDFGQASGLGTGTAYALGDHSHGLPALPELGGDLSGSVGGAFIERLQKVPVKATEPTKGDVLTFDGAAWGPSAVSPPAIEVVSAGMVEIAIIEGEAVTRIVYSSGPCTADFGGGTSTTLECEVFCNAIPNADGPQSGFVVKLTSMLNFDIPHFPILLQVNAVGADSIRFAAILFAGTAFKAGKYQFQFELSRFVPIEGE